MYEIQDNENTAITPECAEEETRHIATSHVAPDASATASADSHYDAADIQVLEGLQPSACARACISAPPIPGGFTIW
jgi:hypothetical protein